MSLNKEGSHLPRGQMHESINKRREIIDRIESLGISREDALVALTQELRMITFYRLDDMNPQSDPLEEIEEATIHQLSKFGVINPADISRIRKIRDAAINLVSAIKK